MMLSTKLAGVLCGVAAAVLVIPGGELVPDVATATAATPAPKVTIVGATASTSNSNVLGLSVTAECPAGTRLVGGLPAINTPNGYFSQLEPRVAADGKSTWNVQINRRTITDSQPLSGGANAYCVTSGPATQIVSKTASVASGRVEVVVPCPAGTHVVGGGAKTPGSYAQAGYLVSSFPSADLSAWNAAAVHVAGGGAISITGYAVCAQQGPATQVKTFTQVAFGQSGAVSNGLAVCPGGTHVLGGGAEVRGGFFDKMLVSSYDPISSPIEWRLDVRMNLWYPNVAKFVTSAICESDQW